jgi:FkbM family methyltransferase
MIVTEVLNYYDITLKYSYDTNDPSGKGCVQEIVHNDEYKLFKYTNITDTIIDIGGNHGLVTCILAIQNPKARIIVLEPIPSLVDIIYNNIKINDITNVVVINKALGDGNDVKLTVSNSYSGASSTIVDNTSSFSDKYNGFSQLDVKSTQFDKLIDSYEIKNIELLKIDCEGGEYYLYDSIYFKNNIVKNIVGEFHNLSYNLDVENKWNYDSLTCYVKKYVSGNIKLTYLTL